jgi:hypothetical protein
MKTKRLTVTSAEYDGDYRIRVEFSDGTVQVVDVAPFLFSHPHPQHDAYRDQQLFQTFVIENGNLVWGENWDLVFPVEQLHRGRIELMQPA